eukprot:COSAG02_NODE_7476_length_2995_cov_1.921271_2_plen_96_part_00
MVCKPDSLVIKSVCALVHCVTGWKFAIPPGEATEALHQMLTHRVWPNADYKRQRALVLIPHRGKVIDISCGSLTVYRLTVVAKQPTDSQQGSHIL